MAHARSDNWNGLVRNEWVRTHPWIVTGVVTLIAYIAVFGTFAGLFPYPRIGEGTVDLLSKIIVVMNASGFVALALGWYFIRRGMVRRHRQAMLTGTIILGVFLITYLEKVGGGGIKQIVGAPAWVENFIYFPLLGIHELLSALAVPLVVYALVIGLTHSISEIPETSHPRIGKLAATTWLLSLFLGVINYALLDVVYSWTYTAQLPF